MAGSELMEAALAYARMGIAVFPLTKQGKVPAIVGGFKKATTGKEQIEALWSIKPELNIGIATGSPSGGLVVIDLDVDDMAGKDGLATLRAWEAVNGELPETASVVTGSGGLHLYYLCEEPVGCSVDADLGVDVRGDGGYVVAPPSIHPNGRPYEFEEYLEDVPIARADERVMRFIRHVQGDARGRAARFRLPDSIGSGRRNDTLYRLACSMVSRGDDDDVIAAYVGAVNNDRCKPPLRPDEVERIVASALSHDKGHSAEVRAQEAARRPALMLNERGKPMQTIDNCTRVLTVDPELAGRFAYNEMAHTRMVELPVPWDRGAGWRAVADHDYCGLSAYMERKYLLTGKERVRDAVVNVAMANRRNPLVEWLDSLSWDGEPRVDTLLPCFLGCDPSDYNVSVMRLFMQGAVARAYEPGVKFDVMPILVGAQGLGKSMFLRRLAARSEWYCDNFATVEGDAAVERLRGMWIVEFAELLATKRSKDVEGIKAFITSTVDVIRPKYGHETEQRPRTCVLAGTTNNPHFLTDKTGNRRFLPVECGAHEPPMSLFGEGVEAYFEQAWAEAVDTYKSGRGSLVLDRPMQAYAMERQRQYLEDDPRVGAIQAYLDERDDADGPVCVAELCERALGLSREDYYGKRSVSNEIHAIMRTEVAGWRKIDRKKMTRAYGAQYCYERIPDEGSEPGQGWE